MRFVKNIFCRKKKETPVTPKQLSEEKGELDIAPELEGALECMKGNCFREAIAAATPYVNSPGVSICADANRLCAISWVSNFYWSSKI